MKKIILSMAAMAMILVACEKDSSELIKETEEQFQLQQSKSKSTTNKSSITSKEAFIDMNFQSQINLWIAKLNQIKLEPISSSQTEEINVLLSEFNLASSRQNLISSQEFQRSAFELLRLTSDVDYLLMFNTLSDYSIQTTIPYRDDLENSSEIYSLLFDDFNNGDPDPNPGANSPCNCNWTCGDAQSSCTHSNCEPTSSGCGFLWAFGCDERDELTSSACAAAGA